jgi:hypothetical protein
MLIAEILFLKLNLSTALYPTIIALLIGIGLCEVAPSVVQTTSVESPTLKAVGVSNFLPWRLSPQA